MSNCYFCHTPVYDNADPRIEWKTAHLYGTDFVYKRAHNDCLERAQKAFEAQQPAVRSAGGAS